MSESYLFEDLKVVDAGSWIAAPVAATILADMGADVIKVETPVTGDGYRTYAGSPLAPDCDVNFTWQKDARNKRSICVNLAAQPGRDILLRLVADADVFITNLTPSLREKWRITREDLARLNPRLIYASLTAYGEQGPERNREGFDMLAYWGRSGLMDGVRSPGGAPAPAMPGMGDSPTAICLYANIVTALLHRHKTGEGAHVHTSLLANGLWSASALVQASIAGANFDRYQRVLDVLYNRIAYEASDGRWFQILMVRTPDEIDRFLTVLGLPELLIDPRLESPAGWVEHGAELIQKIQSAIAGKSSQEWMTEFKDADVPVTLVADVQTVAEDPQIEANGMLMDGADTGMPQVVKPPINIENLPTRNVRRAPEIGEHTDQILDELGFTSEEIGQLHSDGIV
jgi:formyl-CoA transferase